MPKKRKQFFDLRYTNDEPVFLDRFGSEFTIAGVLFQGKEGLELEVRMPGRKACIRGEIVDASVESWIDILRQTDDPEHFEMEPDGRFVKAVHRKCKRNIGQEVQWRVYRNAGFKCEYCNCERPLTVDHYMPVELGGTDEETNLLASCRACNAKKGNMHPDDWIDYMKANNYDNKFI